MRTATKPPPPTPPEDKLLMEAYGEPPKKGPKMDELGYWAIIAGMLVVGIIAAAIWGC